VSRFFIADFTSGAGAGKRDSLIHHESSKKHTTSVRSESTLHQVSGKVDRTTGSRIPGMQRKGEWHTQPCFVASALFNKQLANTMMRTQTKSSNTRTGKVLKMIGKHAGNSLFWKIQCGEVFFAQCFGPEWRKEISHGLQGMLCPHDVHMLRWTPMVYLSKEKEKVICHTSQVILVERAIVLTQFFCSETIRHQAGPSC
jgi:hypothetical protein